MATNVTKIKIVSRSTTVIEGKKFDSPFTFKIVSDNDVPVQNKIIYARIIVYNENYYPAGYPLKLG